MSYPDPKPGHQLNDSGEKKKHIADLETQLATQRSEIVRLEARLDGQTDYGIALQRLIEALAKGQDPKPTEKAPHLSALAAQAHQLLVDQLARAEKASIRAPLEEQIAEADERRKTLEELRADPCENCDTTFGHVFDNNHDRGTPPCTWFCGDCWDKVIMAARAHARREALEEVVSICDAFDNGEYRCLTDRQMVIGATESIRALLATKPKPEKP